MAIGLMTKVSLMSSRINLAVFFGGRSAERAVSCASSMHVLKHIKREKFNVLPIEIGIDGNWTLPTPEGLIGIELLFPGRRLIEKRSRSEIATIDMGYSLLHGQFGDDGAIQGLFEIMGIPYFGSEASASSVCYDKIHMKLILSNGGFPIVPFCWFEKQDWIEKHNEITHVTRAKVGFPCFVKPAKSGSSIGTSLVYTSDAFGAAVKEATRYDRRFLVEAAILGSRELEVSVLGRLDRRASAVGEMIYEGDYFNYHAKYDDTRTASIVPAQIPEQLSARLRDMAIGAYRLLACEGVARIDFLLCPDGNVFLLEVESLPAMTQESMVPIVWKQAGWELETLIDAMAEMARQRNETLQDSNADHSGEVRA
jgi:D-alanine-D-alanine ligase